MDRLEYEKLFREMYDKAETIKQYLILYNATGDKDCLKFAIEDSEQVIEYANLLLESE